MKNKFLFNKNIYKVMLILTFCFTLAAHGQTQYGDGSLLYLGSHSDFYPKTGNPYTYDSLKIEYTSTGKEFRQMKYSFDTLTKTFKIYKLSYNLYDQKDSLILDVDSVYDPAQSYMRYRLEYVYNSDGKKVKRIEYHWNVASAGWVEYSFIEYYYNTKGFQVGTMQQYYDETKKVYLPPTRSDLVYNSNNLPSVSQAYKWDTATGQWLNTNRYKYTYNSYLKLLSTTLEYWNINAWRLQSKSEYFYDADSNLTYKTQYTWDPAKSVWVGTTRDSKVYNSTHGVVMSITEKWNTVSNSWENNSYGQYTLDAKNRIVTNVVSNWTNGSWKPSNKFQYEFNAQGYYTTANYYAYVTADGSWRLNTRHYYSYLPKTILAVKTVPTVQPLSVYPNPANTEFYTTLPLLPQGTLQATLTDMQGRSYSIQPQVNGNALSFSIGNLNLAAGIYSLSVVADQRLYQSRVCIVK